MKTIQIKNQKITVHQYHTLIVGAGAAGMNCAVHLYDFMTQKGVKKAEKKIGVITAGLGLGASRMSGSDKQTYYKMGTSPDVADSAEYFAKSITAAGCVHHDLALAEAVGSLREFYHLVQAGVPFPHDAEGSYIGYKTDHDPYQRATSAGPKTSKFMSECLQRQVERYKIAIHDNQEVARLCNRRKIAYIPGCGTATEISDAEELGVETVKIFPGGTLGGPDFVKALLGPCPWMSVMPTGGVDDTRECIEAWFKAGVTCVGMGSNLVRSDLVATGDFQAITAKVEKIINWIAEIRQKKK